MVLLESFSVGGWVGEYGAGSELLFRVSAVWHGVDKREQQQQTSKQTKQQQPKKP